MKLEFNFTISDKHTFSPPIEWNILHSSISSYALLYSHANAWAASFMKEHTAATRFLKTTIKTNITATRTQWTHQFNKFLILQSSETL